MRADYKNWLPKGMLYAMGAAVFLVAAIGILVPFAPIRIVALILFMILFLIFLWMIALYRIFSYHGKRQMAKKIIEGICAYVDLEAGAKGLDVGCGSGALTIACAKRNPQAHFTGIDRWGKEYASFSKELCEKNALAEAVTNVHFMQGDALCLPFEDESFDFLTSNYVYHNIPSKNRQEILLESLRVLKKGGSFVIHDIFSRQRYGDMEAFVKQLKAMGYSEVGLIPTTEGMFMSHGEALWMCLGSSALLRGKK